MNESTLTQLKILIERAVRPIRASTSRKRKMREELLAHVVEVFQEETARLGDESAALRQTEQRFGSPTELTAQLQESVPASDKSTWLVELLSFSPGTSTFWRAARHATLIGLLTLAVMLTALFTSAPDSAWTTGTLLYCAGAALSFFSMVFGFYFFEDWMRQALFGRAGRSWPRAALVAITCSVFYSGMTFLPGIKGDDVDAPSLAFTTMFFGVAMATLVTTLAKFGALRTQYLEEWSRLPLEPSS